MISISFNPAWLPYVLGALSQLTQLSTWIGDDDAKRLAVERATGLMNLIGLPAATSVPGEPPAPTVTTRYNPTTHTVQTSTDGGTTWVDAPGSDPRKASPLPPQTGTNASCNSAASLRKYLTRFGSVLQLTGGTGVTATGLGYAILALLLDLSGPWAVIFEVIVAAALGLLSAGLTAIDIALDDANLDYIEQQLFCLLNGRTAITEADLTALEAAVTAHIGGTSATIINIILSLMGVGGINSAMALKLDTDDCSGFGCTWCYHIDLTVPQTIVTNYPGQAAFVNGSGFQKDTVSAGRSLIITLPVAAYITTITETRTAAMTGTEHGMRTYDYDTTLVLLGTPNAANLSTTFTINATHSRLAISDTTTPGNPTPVVPGFSTGITLHGNGASPFGSSNC